MPKTIFIAPLNWGLGHATRCIPIISELHSMGHHIILGSDGDAKKLLEVEFPDILMEELPGYGVSYSEKGSFITQMAKQIPQIQRAIRKERKTLNSLIEKHQIDAVISDNRYGLYALEIKSVILTHQIRIKSPLFENAIAKIMGKKLSNFDEVWVPDVQEEVNLSGRLSHEIELKLPISYVGALSRFKDLEPVIKSEMNPLFDDFVLAVISGPEPQRTLFEETIISQGEKIAQNLIVVGGRFKESSSRSSTNIHVIPFADASTLHSLMMHCSGVIARSGYSTIMDLMAVKKCAVLVPTPGQTEQEYLAKHLQQFGCFDFQSQSHFHLKKAIESLKKRSFTDDFGSFFDAKKLKEKLTSL